VKFHQDYIFVLKYKAGVENKVANALSRRVMILVAMSTEVIVFERLREENESCPDFGEIYVMLQDGFDRKMDKFLLQDEYLFRFFVSYIFSVHPSGICSLGECMMEVWLDTSARTRQLRLLNTNSTGRS